VRHAESRNFGSVCTRVQRLDQLAESLSLLLGIQLDRRSQCATTFSTATHRALTARRPGGIRPPDDDAGGCLATQTMLAERHSAESTTWLAAVTAAAVLLTTATQRGKQSAANSI